MKKIIFLFISLFIISFAKADTNTSLKSYLEKNNIGTNIFYPKCLHEIPYLQTDGQLKTDCPIAEKTTTIVLALPIWPELTNEEVEHICSVIKQFKS